MRKLKTDKTQFLHRNHVQNFNPEKPPEDNFQGTQWQIDDSINVPQDDLYTLAWEAEIGGHLSDIPVIYTDPNTIDFGESHIQGSNSVIFPRSYFHDSSDGQNRETCPISDPSIVHPSSPQLQGQSQDVETATDLRHNDSSKQTSVSSTNKETANEPTQKPPSRQNDNHSTIEINDPTTEVIPQNELSHSRGGK